VTRPFAPPRVGLGADFFAGLIEARLTHSGEWVRHIPGDGTASQYVVMNYQFIPVEASITPDYALGGANPKLYGYAPHFETQPTNYREGNSVRAPSGSLFEIRGLMYRVKKVNINHRGFALIELAQEDTCCPPRPEFFTEVEEFSCLDERPCAEV
jgi:hypothetical protein